MPRRWVTDTSQLVVRSRETESWLANTTSLTAMTYRRWVLWSLDRGEFYMHTYSERSFARLLNVTTLWTYRYYCPTKSPATKHTLPPGIPVTYVLTSRVLPSSWAQYDIFDRNRWQDRSWLKCVMRYRSLVNYACDIVTRCPTFTCLGIPLLFAWWDTWAQVHNYWMQGNEWQVLGILFVIDYIVSSWRRCNNACRIIELFVGRGMLDNNTLLPGMVSAPGQWASASLIEH